MKRAFVIVSTLAVLLLFLSGCAREPSEKDNDPTSLPLSEHTSERFQNESRTDTKESVKLIRYSWDGWGTSTKEIDTEELVLRITNALDNMKDTGMTEKKISDDTFDIGGGEYPVDRGTMWIEWGERIYRLSPDLSQISLVETHFGKGNILEITDGFKKDINDAWYYAPYDYYLGSYKNEDGQPDLKNVFASASSIKLAIKDIKIEKDYAPKNEITVELTSSSDQTARVELICQASSDNLSDGDLKTVELKKGIPSLVTLNFGGWPYSYWIYIKADNTMAEIKIVP